MNAFLSSIKVFGYLDKPVFHELAKSLQTKTLSAGELLYDIGSEDRDFYIVVDGAIEIYIKNKNEGDETDGSEDDSDFGDEWSQHFMLNKVMHISQ
jgi:lysophospholipid hydrolase